MPHRLPSANDATARSAAVQQEALRIGFDAVGICDLGTIEHDALTRWIEQGYAADMGYMPRQAARRKEPATIVEGAHRAVVTLSSYYQPDLHPIEGGRVARYAWGDDYHEVIGAKLAELADSLIALGADRQRTRAYVDAGPVPERELAARAGLGWIAKNTMLISPALGSYTFIGCILTDLDLVCDQAFDTDHCGSCRACLDACPTDAFPEERILDARRCISYLTIEHRGDFDTTQSDWIADWIFGCDVCQEVCPWNDKFGRAASFSGLRPRNELQRPSVEQLAQITDASFSTTYRGTAFERTRSRGIRRNARAVVDNTRGRSD